MIKGVVVLAEQTFKDINFGLQLFSLLAFISLFIFVGGIIIIAANFGLRSFSKKDKGLWFGLIAAIILSGIAAWQIHEQPNIIHYKVMITEDVNFKEFSEKYQIIDQEGKIYKITERKD